MEFRPCIDIHNGAVKQIVGGSLRDTGDLATENFVSEQDAAFYARLYQDLGIRGGHVILLNPVTSDYYDATKTQAISALQAWPGGLQVGGGITPENAADFLDAGASHVIVTSYVFRNGSIDYERLDRMVETVGKEHLVLDLSCRKFRAASFGDSKMPASSGDSKMPASSDTSETPASSDSTSDIALLSRSANNDTLTTSNVSDSTAETELHHSLADGKYYVVTDRWQKFTDTEVSLHTLQALSSNCDEFLIHAADVEGKQRGVDEDLIKILAQLEGFPITYAGGVGSFADLDILKTAGKGRLNVTIGSALDLFGGSMPLQQVLAAL